MFFEKYPWIKEDPILLGLFVLLYLIFIGLFLYAQYYPWELKGEQQPNDIELGHSNIIVPGDGHWD